jgi:hypothetical protein
MTSARSLKLSVGAALAGVVMLLAGLAWDAGLHASDPGLAGREGVFTLSNPAHALVAFGLAWVAIGAVGAAAVVFRARRVVAVGAMTLGAVLAATTGVWATSAKDDHPHETLATMSAHDAVDVAVEATTTTSMSDHSMSDAASAHRHSATPYAERVAAATPSERAAAQRILDETKATLARYADERAALADGFRPNPDPRSPNVHYRNAANHRDGVVLDTAKPEGLVYRSGADGSKTLMGAVFSVHPRQVVPFDAYPVVTFHSHDATGCPAMHVTPDQPCDASPRMVHVWLFSGVVDPFGDNAALAAGRTVRAS